jgi:hypothetical protein
MAIAGKKVRRPSPKLGLRDVTLGVTRPHRRRTYAAFEQALSGERNLRLVVTPDYRFVPVVAEDDPDEYATGEPRTDSALGAVVVDSAEVEDADAELLRLERLNHQRLEELRQEPYLDLTVWGPFPGWRRGVLAALVLLGLGMSAIGSMGPIGAVIQAGCGALGVIVGILWMLLSCVSRLIGNPTPLNCHQACPHPHGLARNSSRAAVGCSRDCRVNPRHGSRL